MNQIIDGLPAGFYTDPSTFQVERRMIFANNWLYAAHLAEMPNAGDFVACEIAGFPLLLIRQPDGSVSGLHNICRHRGAPLAAHGCGKLQNERITCKYHGWSYKGTGEIAVVPNLLPISEEDRANLSLRSVRTFIWLFGPACG